MRQCGDIVHQRCRTESVDGGHCCQSRFAVACDEEAASLGEMRDQVAPRDLANDALGYCDSMQRGALDLEPEALVRRG